MKKKVGHLFCRGLIIYSTIVFLSWIRVPKPQQSFYQLTIYHFTDATQEKTLDNYLQHALLPALHRMNIKNVGVFKAIANDTSASKSLYVFISFRTIDQLVQLSSRLNDDADYQTAGSQYIHASDSTPPYNRMEVIMLRAFPLAPQMMLPQLKSGKMDRVYELRSYESATEFLHRNKVRMFNEGGEISIFQRLHFNPVFFGSVIAGSKMPNLMYLTTYENMDDRNALWKNFSTDPAWKKLSSMPEYQHNVSHIDDIFLRPTEYSDF